MFRCFLQSPGATLVWVFWGDISKTLSGDIQNSYARTKHTFFIQIMHELSQAVLETSFWQFEVLTAFMNDSGSFIVFVRNYEKFEVVLQFFYKSNGVIFKTLLVFYSRACFLEIPQFRKKFKYILSFLFLTYCVFTISLDAISID